MLIALSLAHAQVTPIPPFTGAYQEDFDAASQTAGAIPCVPGTFGGVATVCASEADVGGMQVRPSLFLGCEQTARSDPHLASSNDGPTEIGGGAAFSRFGGWFGTHTTNGGDLRVELYAADGSLLLQDTVAFNGSCQWQWLGYEATGAPIARALVIRTAGDGALATLDDLQLDLACGPDDLDCDGSNAAADCDDRDALRTPGAAEDCDGIDNDCDGVVPANESDADGDGWPACDDCDDQDPSVRPDATTDVDCNGVDEDCDGVEANDGAGPPPASLTQGVCAGAVQVCDGAGWAEPDYTALPGYEPTELTCDGLDNDCDGEEDAGLEPPPFLTGEGVCASIEPVCEGVSGWVDPADPGSAYEPEETACDGRDNDCDGETDEAPGPLALLQDGVCAGVTQICVDGELLEPVYADVPDFDPVERCDGLDNDCNGLVDDACVKERKGLFGCATSPGPGGLFAVLPLLALARRRARAG